MRRRLTRHLSFANVMSVVAVFIALGGTAFAFALGKNSVGAKQIKPNAVSASELKKNAVTTAKIKDAAVTTAKIAANAVTGAQVADGSLGAADIDQASLTNVRAGNVTSVSAEGDCTLHKAVAGVTTDHPVTGSCSFDFHRDVSACDAVAAVDIRLTPNQILPAGQRTVFVTRNAQSPTVIGTRARFGDTSAQSDLPVTLLVVC